MVSADDSSQSFGGLTAQIGWFGLRVGGHPVLSLHSLNEPGELSQWLCHDDSTINIVSNIIIYHYLSLLLMTVPLLRHDTKVQLRVAAPRCIFRSIVPTSRHRVCQSPAHNTDELKQRLLHVRRDVDAALTMQLTSGMAVFEPSMYGKWLKLRATVAIVSIFINDMTTNVC